MGKGVNEKSSVTEIMISYSIYYMKTDWNKSFGSYLKISYICTEMIGWYLNMIENLDSKSR